VDVVYLSFKEAFDTVSCNTLIDMLIKYRLGKCSEVDGKLAEQSGRWRYDKQYKVQLEVSVVPQALIQGPVLSASLLMTWQMGQSAL